MQHYAIIGNVSDTEWPMLILDETGKEIEIGKYKSQAEAQSVAQKYGAEMCPMTREGSSAHQALMLYRAKTTVPTLTAIIGADSIPEGVHPVAGSHGIAVPQGAAGSSYVAVPQGVAVSSISIQVRVLRGSEVLRDKTVDLSNLENLVKELVGL